VERAAAGEREALEDLVRRHQAWIYNIAIRMLAHPQDAEDATQEVLIKASRGCRRSRAGAASGPGSPDRREPRPEHEARAAGAEALTFSVTLTGSITRPTSILPTRPACRSTSAWSSTKRGSAALLECYSASTARNGSSTSSRDPGGQRCHRGRAPGDQPRQLPPAPRTGAPRSPQFHERQCGLVDPVNPCRCEKKTRGFIQAGYVDPNKLLFARARITHVRSVVPQTDRALTVLDAQCARVYREHPFYEAPDIVPALRRLIESDEFRRATDLP